MRFVSALAVVTLSLSGLAAPAAAADTAPPVVRGIEFSRERIEVSGLGVELLVVDLRLTDETGVNDWDSVERGHFPAVAIGDHVVALRLGRGTPQDGWYTGGIAVTSGWPSTNRPTRAYVMDTAGNEADVDLAALGITLPTVTVTSTGRPTLRLLMTPDPAPVRSAINPVVRVTDATGRPWPDVPVQVGYDNLCVEHLTPAPDGRTDASGVYTAPQLPAGRNYPGGFCARITSDLNIPGQIPTYIAIATTLITYRTKITATPARTSVRAGTDVEVSGNLQPEQQGTEVELQRLYRDGGWRTVNRARTRPSSRFTVIATPPGRATHSYRVLVRADGDRPAATSPAFTIRGT
jgi:hypothetical protein